jgi:hypothetical protein
MMPSYVTQLLLRQSGIKVTKWMVGYHVDHMPSDLVFKNVRHKTSHVSRDDP